MWLTIVLTALVITLFRLNSTTANIAIQFHQTKVVEEDVFQIINETEGILSNLLIKLIVDIVIIFA